MVLAAAHGLQRLPGIGEKAGLRHATYLAQHPEYARTMGILLCGLADAVGVCERCGGLAEKSEGQAVCAICLDGKRDSKLLCVVAKVQDMLAIERSGAMRGRYCVLGKMVSPVEGVELADLPLYRLWPAIDGSATEVLLALPASVEGMATALALSREITEYRPGVRVSRIATGVAHGADLEYSDPVTLTSAIRGRTEVRT